MLLISVQDSAPYLATGLM